jgi:hypothetical protein
MFENLIKKLKTLEYKEKGQFFVKLMDGKLLLHELLELDKKTQGSFEGLSIVIRNAGFIDPVLAKGKSIMSLYFPHDSKEQQEKKLISNFKNLPISDRLNEYKSHLKFPINSEGYKEIKEQENDDITFLTGIRLLVVLYVSLICDQNIPTIQQLGIATYLMTDKFSQSSNIQHQESQRIVNEFIKLYTLLTVYGFPDDKLALLAHIINKEVSYQIKAEIPVNKQLRFLAKLKEETNHSFWNNVGWQWKFWAGKTPDGIKNLRTQLKILPTELEACLDSKKIDAIKSSFEYAHTLFRSKTRKPHVMSGTAEREYYFNKKTQADTVVQQSEYKGPR